MKSSIRPRLLPALWLMALLLLAQALGLVHRIEHASPSPHGREAVALSALGGFLGLLLGFGLAQLIHLFLPALPVHTPLSFVLLAELVAIVIGLAAGVLPARRAAQLDPVEALRTE